MSLFFISDIHGSIYYLRKALEAYEREKCNNIIILGDILYHGPRNIIPEGYNPKEVIEVLNTLKDRIIAVKGNCDSEVDEMVLNFPILSEYGVIFYNGRRVFITHGHKYNEDNPITSIEGDIVISGHTHLPRGERIKGVYYINPGSITLPKENNKHSYGLIKDDSFFIKDLEGNIMKTIELN
ncbi:phosphodiesterase [Clostridium sp.]|uniref:phosphodiesterase n=1 Tax=Clostridium sp. TaxID=1506 RepID=UPI0034641165